jgi:CBS domain-containing protein
MHILMPVRCNPILTLLYCVQVMHKAFKIKPETTMEAAANLVVNKKAHRICVVDEDDRLIGIVSRGDIMRATMVHFAAYMDHKDKAQAASS